MNAIRKAFFLMLVMILVIGLLPGMAIAAPAQATDDVVSATAVALVDSASANFDDFAHFTQAYLDHFGVPYTLIDIATMPVPADIGNYSLIIIGHRGLDIGDTYLDAAEEGYLSSAVSTGTGLVNFDNDLFSAGLSRYAFIQDVFGFTSGGATSGSGVSFPTGVSHYITSRHTPGTNRGTGSMSLPGVVLPGDVTMIATTGTQPFLAVTSYGTGRAVQWGSYDWMSYDVLGPMYGLDDLVWRSLVWAARKPFVMQGMPPFVTMRSDDESGNFEWIHIANEFGIKPWAGVFFSNIDAAEAADLSALVHAGQATASIHAYNGSFFYFNHGAGDFSDATVAANYAAGTAWHTANNIPISDFVLPHYYEFGTNVFQGLEDWGVEFVGTQMDPGQGYGAPWIMSGPFRRFETGGSSAAVPQYSGDYMTIPGHPEFNRQFFNCVTEIRDDNGYEWYPNLNDVADTIGHGTRQLERALDAMALPTLFTHGYYISGSWGASAPANWRAILQGITDNIESYNPIFVTMDDACRHIRATYNSNITTSTYDTVTREITTSFGAANGGTGTDVATKYYIFMDGEGYVLADTPAFNGTTTVNFTIPGALHHITVTPNPGSVVAGTSLQFSATGYDVDNNPIPNLSFDWSVVNGGGTVNVDGVFTAGVTPGTYTNTLVASRNGVNGAATVTVTEPIIHHFEFATIVSPKYINMPFSITIRARDAANNLVPGYVGSVTLSDTTGTIAPTTVGPFTAGVWSGPVILGSAAMGVTISALDGAISGVSNSFDVLAAPTCPCSIWDLTTVPTNPHVDDPQPLEVGVKFRSATDGSITALRVYRSSGNYTATSLIGHLWTSNGTLLAEVNLPAAAAAGWQEVSLPGPVDITADTTYVASYFTNAGYPVTRPYFTLANQALYERPPLRALVDGEQGGNGVYFYNATPVFPTNTYESSNYHVDVVFETEEVEDTTPPAITALNPPDYATGVSVNSDITVTFSEAMDATTIASANFELRDATNALVPATVTYEPATFTARLNPTAPLGYGAPYSALVKGGAGGVADLAGNTLLSDRRWSFTTVAAPALHHFSFATIPSPQTAGIAFMVTITARDASGDLFAGYSGYVELSASSGAVSPYMVGPFVDGQWSGNIALSLPGTGITLMATDGAISGSSNSFIVEGIPPYYEVASPTYVYAQDTSFPVTVTAYQTTINVWENDHQDPDLATTTDPLQIVETDGLWTEYHHVTGGRPFPSVMAGASEFEDYNLPLMRFHTSGIPNGRYEVIANLYTNTSGRNMRYFWGYSSASPKQYQVDTIGGSGGTDEHTEYSLGFIQVTDNTFNLYVQDADMLTGSYPIFGWAHVRLVASQTTPQELPITFSLADDNHQSPVLTTFSNPDLLNNTNSTWDEFLYTLSRPYPTLLAGHNEWESYGLTPMHFFHDSVPNGQYEVWANLYTTAIASSRHYYGYTEAEALALARYVDNIPGQGGSEQHAYYLLGTVTITNGRFDLWASDGDTLTGGPYYYGWAHIRLTPVASLPALTLTSSSPGIQFDGDGDGIFGEPGDNVKELVNGTFTISARGSIPGTGINIIATDELGQTGQAAYDIEAPTAVTMNEWSAQAQANRVVVSWSTIQEIDLSGFNVYRSTLPDGPRTRLNPSLIPASGELMGASYQYEDNRAKAGSIYYYWIEVVEIGRVGEWIGPMYCATLYQMFIPWVRSP